MVRTGNFRYVPYEQIDEYHFKGWTIVGYLGVHSVLMWTCDCCNWHKTWTMYYEKRCPAGD